MRSHPIFSLLETQSGSGVATSCANTRASAVGLGGINIRETLSPRRAHIARTRNVDSPYPGDPDYLHPYTR